MLIIVTIILRKFETLQYKYSDFINKLSVTLTKSFDSNNEDWNWDSNIHSRNFPGSLCW